MVGVLCWCFFVDVDVHVDVVAAVVDEVNIEVDGCLLWLYMLMLMVIYTSRVVVGWYRCWLESCRALLTCLQLGSHLIGRSI